MLFVWKVERSCIAVILNSLKVYLIKNYISNYYDNYYNDDDITCVRTGYSIY